MQKTLAIKLARLREKPHCNEFILADAKDADMAFGIASPGQTWNGLVRSLRDYRDQIREIVQQGLVDIVLMSASTSEILTIKERIFDDSPVTPAVRANDTSDVHILRGAKYAEEPSQPFSSTTIDHIQSGKLFPSKEERRMGANLGLYSVTFNNLLQHDLQTMAAFKSFRLEAEEKGFEYFLEVFAPNVSSAQHGLAPGEVAGFVNDHIVRLLAGVPSRSRPRFLKIPYQGPTALEELCTYDPSLIVGVLGGSAGTTLDAFDLLYNAKKYGARVALFGRKINSAEHQLSFVEHLRHVADDEMLPREAVNSYHSRLAQLGIRPRRTLEDDMQLTTSHSSYAGAGEATSSFEKESLATT